MATVRPMPVGEGIWLRGSRLTIPEWAPPVPGADTLNQQNNISKSVQNILGEGSTLPLMFGTSQVGGRYLAGPRYISGTWYAAIGWCAGPIQAIDAVYLNGELAVSGVTRTDYLGSTGQGVDPTLQSVISGYADTFVFDEPGGNVPACYSVFTWTDIHYKSIPQFVMRGRGALTNGGSFSANPAHAISFLISDPSVGLGESFDSASFAAVATDCNATISTEARRIIGLTLDAPLPTIEQIKILAAYASCWVYKLGGTWYATSDRPRSQDAALTETNYLQGQFGIDIQDRDSQPTVVEVVYTDTSENIWRERVATAELSGVSTGTVPKRVSRVRMPGVTRYSQAMREAKERLNKLQRYVHARYMAFDDEMVRTPGDVVDLTHAMGITNMDFRVNAPPQMTRMGRMEVQCVQYSADDYDDSEEAAPTPGESKQFEGAGVSSQSGAQAGADLLNESGAIIYDIDVRNDQLVTQALSALNANPSMQLQRVHSVSGNAAPASWFSTGSGASLRYEDSATRDVLRIGSGSGMSVFNAALSVNPDTEYEVTALVKYTGTPSGSPTLSLGWEETTDNLASGERVVATGHAGGAGDDPASLFHTANTTRRLAVNGGALSTSYQLFTGTISPGNSAKWASIWLNPADNGGVTTEVEWCVIREKSTRNTGALADLSSIDPSYFDAGSLGVSINVGTGGNLRSGKTSFGNAAAGFWIGIDGGVAKFIFGNSDSSKEIQWDGSSLRISGGFIVGGTQLLLSDADLVDSTTAGSTANCTYRINNDKTVDGHINNNLKELETWLRGEGLVGDFDVRATLTSGSSSHFSAGTFNTWQALSSTRTWTLTHPTTVGSRTALVTYELRDSSTLEVLASNSVEFNAIVV